MSTAKRVISVMTTTATAVAIGLHSTPAVTLLADEPCSGVAMLICRILPIAPDLEGDIDLTEQQPPAGPESPPAESLPPADPCTGGCA